MFLPLQLSCCTFLVAYTFFVPAFVHAYDYNCSIPLEGELDNRKDKSKWSIAQFNVEWLFTEQYKDCPGDGCSWSTLADADKHLQVVAERIRNINVDTVHLCEVESCTQLRQLIELLPEMQYEPFLIEGKDTYTGQNVGLLTRLRPTQPLERTEERMNFPLEGSKCGYTGENGTEGVSKHLLSYFNIANRSIVLLGAHLLSKPTDPTACAKREAQSLVLQSLVQNHISNNTEIILLGDMNDYDGEIMDINGNIPTSCVLSTLKSSYSNPQSQNLYSVAGYVKDVQDRYTEWWDENENCSAEMIEYSAIDHVLLSKGLYTHVIAVDYNHDYIEYCDTYDSDHYPIVFELELT